MPPSFEVNVSDNAVLPAPSGSEEQENGGKKRLARTFSREIFSASRSCRQPLPPGKSELPQALWPKPFWVEPRASEGTEDFSKLRNLFEVPSSICDRQPQSGTARLHTPVLQQAVKYRKLLKRSYLIMKSLQGIKSGLSEGVVQQLGSGDYRAARRSQPLPGWSLRPGRC